MASICMLFLILFLGLGNIVNAGLIDYDIYAQWDDSAQVNKLAIGWDYNSFFDNPTASKVRINIDGKKMEEVTLSKAKYASKSKFGWLENFFLASGCWGEFTIKDKFQGLKTIQFVELWKGADSEILDAFDLTIPDAFMDGWGYYTPTCGVSDSITYINSFSPLYGAVVMPTAEDITVVIGDSITTTATWYPSCDQNVGTGSYCFTYTLSQAQIESLGCVDVKFTFRGQERTYTPCYSWPCTTTQAVKESPQTVLSQRRMLRKQ